MTTPITLSELLDIIDGGSPEERFALAQKFAPMFLPQMQEAMRSGALEDVRQNFWPRVTVDDADVVNNSAGAAVWGGPSRFAVFDFPNFTGWIDDDDGNTVHLQAPGGGADCMFDYLVSPCFASLSGFTEGKVFPTASSCTFIGYSTVQGAATAISALAGGSKAVLFICGGQYNENVLFTGPATGGVVTIIGAGRERTKIVGQTSAGCTLQHSGGGTTFHVRDLSITGHASALSRSVGDDSGTSYWTISDVNIATGSNASSIGVDTGVTSTRWKLSRVVMTGSGIGFTDGTGGDSSDLWGGVILDDCSISTAIAARFVNDSSFYMNGGEITGAIGIQNNSNFTSFEVYCVNVRFACSTAAVQCTGAGGFDDALWLGCRFINCTKAFDWGTAANVSNQVRIIGNNFDTNTGTDIGIDDTSGALSLCVIVGNSFKGYNANNEMVGLDTTDNQIAHNTTASGATLPDAHGVTLAPVGADYLVLTANATLTNERVFTPRNNAYATDGGVGAAYTFDSWRKGADIASASQLALGTDGDYFHVTGTTGISSISASGYKALVLAQSPGGYWRLGEASGNAADSSGNGNTATAVGGITYSVAGALVSDPNTAVTPNGTTGYFSVADAATVDPGDTFTVKGWIKKAANGTTMSIMDKGTNAFQLLMLNTNALTLWKSGVSQIVTATTTITDSNWHHVAATKSGSTVHLYVDGVDVTGTVTNATCVTNASALHLGHLVSGAGGGQFWNGSLDELSVLPTALTAAQILAEYNAGVGGAAAGARILLEFDGACTLTHSTSLILQAAANYTTAAGDVLEFVYEGSNNWREVNRHTATNHDPVTLAADADVLLGITGQQLTLDSQNANIVLAGPISGGAADPTFRALVLADLPAVRTKGTGTIASGATSATITHGTGTTPLVQDIIITPSNNPTNDPGNIWVDTIGATTFAVNCRNDPGVGGMTFGWSVLLV